MEGKSWLVQRMLKVLEVFPSETVEIWRDVWKGTEEDTGNVKRASSRQSPSLQHHLS